MGTSSSLPCGTCFAVDSGKYYLASRLCKGFQSDRLCGSCVVLEVVSSALFGQLASEPVDFVDERDAVVLEALEVLG